MIELETSIRLMIGLATALFAVVTVLFSRVSSTHAAIGAVGLAPLLVWIAAPEFLAVAQLEVPLYWARPAVLLVGAAIVFRYLATRSGGARRGARRGLGVASGVLLWVGAAVTTGNWIVAVSVILPAIVAAVVIPAAGPPTSEASSREDREPPHRRPDS
ncbi:MAG: hypothetical protein ACOC8L_06355 [Spirochaetota bacterium]